MKVNRASTIFRCSICGNESTTWIFEHITELLTAMIGKNSIYQWKNMDSKIIDIANSKTCKHKWLSVEYTILIRHYYQSAKTNVLYESIDGHAGRPADNPPNSHRFGDVHQTVLELMLRVYWEPGPPIWQRLGWDPDPDLKWPNGTVANTTHDLVCWPND